MNQEPFYVPVEVPVLVTLEFGIVQRGQLSFGKKIEDVPSSLFPMCPRKGEGVKGGPVGVGSSPGPSYSTGTDVTDGSARECSYSTQCGENASSDD